MSPGDYTARTNTLVTIPAGQSSATIAIPIANDVIDEDNETFTVTLDAGSETGTGTLGAALIGTPNAATVTITDDDDLPTLRIGDASVREEIASGTVSQTITLSPVSGRDVMVNYTTQDGTAKDGVSDADPADYVATSSVATIPAGSTFLTFNVTIVDDAIKEPDEVFNVVLSSPVNATLADASSAITIIDDEVRPEVSIDDVEVVEGANASFTISQDIVAGEDTLVDYDTSDGTATAGSDYTAVSDGTANHTSRLSLNDGSDQHHGRLRGRGRRNGRRDPVERKVGRPGRCGDQGRHGPARDQRQRARGQDRPP